LKSFDEFIETIRALRAPDGCPWDKEQTFKTLTPHIIEEAYEVVDAIQNDAHQDLKEELGDMLLHVVMLSNMAEEESLFNIGDVVQAITDKMINRHPHVFGDKKADSVEEVWDNWEAIKKKEKSGSPLNSIPMHFPALMQAEKIQKKVARLGFDWPNIEGSIDKLQEEIQEVKEELEAPNPNKERVEEEVGDMLFSLVNILRKMKLNPEEALANCNKKFIKRFNKAFDLSEKNSETFSDLSLDRMTEYWEEAKQSER
jgi:ATP diphosphatase